MVRFDLLYTYFTGVTRRSVLELAREWAALEGGVALEVNERRLTMGEVVKASGEGRVRDRRESGLLYVACSIPARAWGGWVD